MLRTAVARSRQISVGIVGAGFAGLRCADVLLQHGFKVTVLEARNRLGGRVAQSNHLGHLVDLGPNWIHGSNDNPIMKIAHETGTKLHAWDEEAIVYDPEGKPLEDKEVEQHNALLWDDGLIAAAFKYSNEYYDSIDPQRSLFDFFSEKVESLFEDEPADIAKRKRKTLLQFASLWGCYIGSPVTRQSLRFFWLEEVIEGENPFVAETYHKILDAVAGPAKQGADIRLKREVLKIHSKASTSETDGHAPEASVKLADGESLAFDEVVVTCPLGWLKGNKAAFEPELTPRLSSAIDSISYGTLDKVYITFPKAFWNSSGPSPLSNTPNRIDPEGTTPNVTATTTPLHQPRSDNKTTPSPSLLNWLHPNYASSTNPEQWEQFGMNLAALREDCAQPTILFYIQGPQSKHIGELVASSKNEQDRDEKLKAFFEPYYSLLPNFSTKDPNCTPKAFLATAWAIDKFAGYGSYANFQVGLEKGDEDIETMRFGMPDRHVWLAGEHTAPFLALGTSTGAYWSGEAVGERIVKAYGRENNKEKATS
ncbi:hypothetical protein M409DRAFT_64858 [Zasmidium cellare ATCC 36951]|uniref:Amine oxidase domain-containing protein n=1 Tax=Zasmidium cellare ATCC 36951 TaxID=1080233 RepID=A0A6A6CWI8_ZASCE|nr:uncharacterized protein M409DRAFT_64858 [Zasmidium cellare ATCC 36951]KAF2169876.1 hypothetical protein M409DRAFT_64858 [Zasmidium cellare ATCC 36951]